MKENFSYYIKKYFTSYLPTTRGLAPSTIKTYKCNMLLYIKYLKSINIDVDNLELKDFTFSFIEDYISYLKIQRKNKSKTIGLKLEVLKSFFLYLSLETIDAIDIYELIKKIKLSNKEVFIPDYLTSKEIELLLLQPLKNNNIKELALLTLLYDGGLRVSELYNLKVEDIIFDNINKIYIKNSKNNNSRMIPISKEDANILKLYLKQYELKKTDYLFLNKYGNKYTQKGINYILNKNFDLAKKECNDSSMFKVKCHPHIIRHSKAIHLLDCNVDIINIRDFLGHKHISTTEIYARVTDERKEKILLENAIHKPAKAKYTKKEKDDLESWLEKNI